MFTGNILSFLVGSRTFLLLVFLQKRLTMLKKKPVSTQSEQSYNSGYDSFSTNDNFAGKMLTHFIFGIIQWTAILYTICFVVINGATFCNYYVEERDTINDAIERYNRVCEPGREDAQFFYATCTNDKRTMQKVAALEALQRLARKFQICGENGCTNVTYMLGGACLGIIFFIWMIPKLKMVFQGFVASSDDKAQFDFIQNKSQ